MRTMIVLTLLACPFTAEAATVGSASTQVGDTNGIVPLTGTSFSPTFQPADWIDAPTMPASDWVWNDPITEWPAAGSGSDAASATYQWSFSLTGFDVVSAVLSGVWAADNFGTVTLNGTVLSSLVGDTVSNFDTLHPFSTTDDSHFVAGLNTLSLNIENVTLSVGLRSAVTVTADIASVPGPTAWALSVTGVAAFFGLQRRRASA